MIRQWDEYGFFAAKTAKELRKLYHRAARKEHPDSNQDLRSHERFIKMRSAYLLALKTVDSRIWGLDLRWDNQRSKPACDWRNHRIEYYRGPEDSDNHPIRLSAYTAVDNPRKDRGCMMATYIQEGDLHLRTPPLGTDFYSYGPANKC